MADEEKVGSEEGKEMAKASPRLFKVTNVVRRVNSRVRRALAPGRRRFKQYVCGKRLLRKQSILISEEEMIQHEKRLYEQVKEGAIEITTPEGVVISADALGNIVGRKGMKVEVMEGAPPPPPPPADTAVEPPKPEEPKADPPEEPPADTAVEPPAETEEETVIEPDDLTELPGVGPGRVKKLTAAGIITFKQLAQMAPQDLVKVLGSPVTEDQAADICDAASEKDEEV
jgi:predicted flap endonuclease-1-like 5' DNA nuclease